MIDRTEDDVSVAGDILAVVAVLFDAVAPCEAAAVQLNGSSLILMVRLDPLTVASLGSLRDTILSDMKGDELEDALAAYGAELTHSLDSSAMNKLPASKIDNSSSSNS